MSILQIDRHCPICNYEVEIIENPYPLFRHLDFTTISKGGNFLKCTYCQTISNANAINTRLHDCSTKQYADSNQTDHIMHIDRYPKPVSRSFLQAKFLTESLITNQYSRILDIGCFDGRLLLEFDDRLSNADLWGFDINHHLGPTFPKKDNFHFISTRLDDIKGLFDLITLSYSIL